MIGSNKLPELAQDRCYCLEEDGSRLLCSLQMIMMMMVKLQINLVEKNNMRRHIPVAVFQGVALEVL